MSQDPELDFKKVLKVTRQCLEKQFVEKTDALMEPICERFLETACMDLHVDLEEKINRLRELRTEYCDLFLSPGNRCRETTFHTSKVDRDSSLPGRWYTTLQHMSETIDHFRKFAMLFKRQAK